jgi:glycosyltransferase involved in cell wall biosynthesis/GR25 family glycosyltransferase involved in LPS biosynthesis
MATVSVIIPTYNRFNYLLNAIESVRSQTHPCKEIIVINDGSTQPEYYTHDFGPDVTVLHQEKNSKSVLGFVSIGYTRNIGIQQATGDYIAFLDDDDVWLPRKIELQLNAMQAHGCKMSATDGFIGGGFYRRDKSYSLYNAEYHIHALKAIFQSKGSQLLDTGIPNILTEELLAIHNCIIASSVIVDRSLLNYVGNMDNLGYYQEDYACWLKVIKHTNCVYIAEPCLYFDTKNGEWSVAKYEVITPKNAHVLEDFLTHCTSPHFRYFATRSIHTVLKHTYTVLGVKNGLYVSYGHIDYEDGKYWIGLCVCDEYQKKGLGTDMLEHLLAYFEKNLTHSDRVHLSVDASNTVAIRLYEKFGFQTIARRNDGDAEIVMMVKMFQRPHMTVELPISFGEAFDKLTILDIKSKKIQNEVKLTHITHEMTKLKQSIGSYVTPAVQFWYRILFQINLHIWELQDTFRETQDPQMKQALCEEIIQYNDRRFNVKHKIDKQLNSGIQEQKGYKPKTLVIIPHQGLGDLLTCVGLIRYMSTQYDDIYLVTKHKKNAARFFADDQHIHYVSYEGRGSPCDVAISVMGQKLSDYETMMLGYFNNADFNAADVPFSFYTDYGIPRSVLWSYFYICDTAAAVADPNCPRVPYIFIHNTTSNGLMFGTEEIEERFKFSKDECMVINPERCEYAKSHPFYETAVKYVGLPLIEYTDVIRNAAKIIVTDSCFFCLAINLEIKTDECYYVPRDCLTSYDYMYSKQSAPPSFLNRRVFRRLDMAIPTERMHGGATFMTFGNAAFAGAVRRICNQAKETGVFDTIIAYGEDDLRADAEFWRAHGEFITRNARGYGYWIWKPYLIHKTLAAMKDGDILLYLDAGCEMNPLKRDMYHRYFKHVKRDLVIGTKLYDLSDIQFTKMDLLRYMGMEGDYDKICKGQRQAGLIMMYVCPRVRELVKEWYDIACTYNLLDDSPSVEPNNGCFIEHRHDMAIFSLLTKKHGIFSEHTLETLIDVARNRTETSKFDKSNLTLDTFVDAIYYINLDHRTDRKERLLSEFYRIGIPDNKVQRVPGIYTKENGYLGCVASHIQTLKMFLDSGKDKCLVLEDDFVFTQNADEINRILSQIKGLDFDVLMISGNVMISEPHAHNSYVKRIIDAQTTSSYIVTRNYAPILLANFEEGLRLLTDNQNACHIFALDQYWKRLQPVSKWYITNPVFGKQGASFSNIVNLDVDYNV